MPNSCNGVQALEGLTLDQLDDFITSRASEYIPILGPVISLFEDNDSASRKEILNYLEHVIRGGDPDRIDRGEEAVIVARYFYQCPRCEKKIEEKDVEDYTVAYFQEKYEKGRGEIAEKYNLSPDFAFSPITETIPIEQYSTFRGSRVFEQLADTLPALLTDIPVKRKINFLYPGSGSHIAPLLTAMGLINAEVIDEASFIYTEIDKDSFYNLYYLLREALDKGVFEEVSANTWTTFANNDGSERNLTIRYKGKFIHIKFVLNHGGARYYRKDHLDWADVVIIHDPESGFFEGSVNLLSQMLIDAKDGVSPKNRLVVMEGHSEDYHFASSDTHFPDGMKQTKIVGQYGHCSGIDYVGEIKNCAYSSAGVFLLNDPPLVQMASKFQDAIELSLAIYTPPPRVYITK